MANHQENQEKEWVLFLKRNIIFIFLLIIIVFLEINTSNHQFFVNTFQNLRTYDYHVTDTPLYGFELVDGQLISQHIDPNITLRDIDDRIRYLTIQCTNPNPEALSQVFYRRVDEDFTEENSITFPLTADETTVSLPKTINVTSLRLDLTNTEGDVLTCQSFILNPDAEFNVSYLRLALLAALVILIIFNKQLIPERYSDAVWSYIVSAGVWVFIPLIILINLAYPITVTFDSAHYLWLTNVMSTGTWASWDPIRYIGFPLYINLTLTLMGHSQIALLYSMIFAQILAYFFGCQIVFDIFNLQKGKNRFIVALLVFLIVAMSPTVLGYYHTLLTEFAAGTIAIISCAVAIKLYQSKPFSKRFFWLSSFYLVMVPIAWHIKQPYIGAAYFPLVLVSLLVFFKKMSFKKLAYLFGMHLAVVILVIVSTLAWNAFLQAQGNPMKQERLLTSFLERRLSEEGDIVQDSSGAYLGKKIDDYLAISNLYKYDFGTRSVIRSPRVGRGNENTVIAHRMFINPGLSTHHFYGPRYEPYARFLKSTYNPPVWLNNLFRYRLSLSNVVFTVTNLALPFAVVIMLVFWIREKNSLNASLLMLSGSSLMNLVAHIMLVIPIDRYQFWGYMLNLLVLIILLIHLFLTAQKKGFLLRLNR